jgi:hypothetical protein
MHQQRAVRVAAAALVVAAVAGCDSSANDRASSPDASTAAASTSTGEAAKTGSEIAQRVQSFVDPGKNAIFRPIRAVIIEVDGVTVLEHYYRGSASDTSNVFSVTKSVIGTPDRDCPVRRLLAQYRPAAWRAAPGLCRRHGT